MGACFSAHHELTTPPPTASALSTPTSNPFNAPSHRAGPPPPSGQHAVAPTTAPRAKSDAVDRLLPLLQRAAKPPSHPGAAAAVQPERLLAQIDKVLQELEHRSAGGGGSKAAGTTANTSAAVDKPSTLVGVMSAGCNAVAKAITPIRDGRAFGANWDALAHGAVPVLTSVGPLSYVGPAFALLGYALKQWSTFEEVPGEAVEMLRACRHLLAALCASWTAVSGDQQRAARWVATVAKAAAECVVVHEGRVATRFFVAHVHKQQLAEKAATLDRIRLELDTSLTQECLMRLEALLLVRQEIVQLEGKKGINGLVAELALSLLDPGGGVRGLLLHGMGGIGKSTIANQLCHVLNGTGRFASGVFSASVLLDDQQRSAGGITRAVPPGALLAAQTRLLELVSGRKVDAHSSLDVGCSLLKQALLNKAKAAPVLVLVDNVPEASGGIQGMLPQGLQDCMPAGSRLVFTSRSDAPVGLALPHDAIARREVPLLGDGPAAEVVRAELPQALDSDLHDILAYCKGLPLALTVVAGALAADPGSKGDVLRRLRRNEAAVSMDDSRLQESLMFSIDILPPALREAWLDIVVLLYREAPWPELERFYGGEVMASLKRRNLLQRDEEWDRPVVHDVLRCIAQSLCGPGGDQVLPRRDALRLVASGRVQSKAPCAGINSRMVSSTADSLEVDVPNGSLRIVVAGRVSNLEAMLEAQATLQWLRVLDADLTTACQSFGQLSALQRLDLSGCSQLAALPESFGQLSALQRLDLRECPQLLALPESFGQLSALQRLDLSWCWQLLALPASFGQLSALQHLDLSRCYQLSALPASFGQLPALQHLNLMECSQLSALPESFGQLSTLQLLDLRECSQLSALPERLGELSALQHLFLCWCSQLSALPESLGQLSALQRLDLTGCWQLSALPASLGQLSALQELGLYGCSQLSTLAESFGQLSALQRLGLKDCRQLSALPESFGELSALLGIGLRECTQLSALPESFGQLSALQEVDLSECSQLLALPESFGRLSALRLLDLSGCSQLSALPASFGQLSALQHLDLSRCSRLSALPASFGQLSALRLLDLRECTQLSALPQTLGQLSVLQHLFLCWCSQLSALPESIGQLSALQELRLSGCSQLSALPQSFGQLSALRELSLFGCSKLSALPESIGQLSELNSLDLGECPQLAAVSKTLGRVSVPRAT